MCGIAGYISEKKPTKKIIKAMTDRIAHRGPDGEGFYLDDNIALGHRRLAILDLETGDQPIYNEDKDIVVILNGEIYNYQELRDELKKKKHKFSTKTDTEVLVHGYEEWGHELTKKLRGMYAFAIWNKNEKELYIARDGWGIKPLYYYQNGKTLMFASEIKAFLDHPDFKKEFNDEILSAYLCFNSVPTEETFFKGVKRVEPGHQLIYKDNKLEIERFFKLEFDEQNTDIEKSAEEINEAMKDSVKRHFHADVEVGSLLSSGVDSSYIVSIGKPNKTFTVGYDDPKYNEINYAEDLTEKLGIQNISKKMTQEEYIKNFPKLMYHMDEPLADPSIIALHSISELASHHVKVITSGEGADELFGGYPFYKEDDLLIKYRKIPFFIRKAIKSIISPLPEFHGKNFLTKGGSKVEDYFIGEAFVFNNKEANSILSDKYKSNVTFQDITRPYYNEVKDKDDLTKMQYLDMHFWLPNDILLKADKMSMANSLELRVPILDKEVFKLASTIQTDYKLSHNTTKYILRKAASSRIPEAWYKRPKKGFPVPIIKWFREEKYYNLAKNLFNEEFTKEFFNIDKLNKMLDEHYYSKKNHCRKIWTVYVFLTWYKTYFIDFN